MELPLQTTLETGIPPIVRFNTNQMFQGESQTLINQSGNWDDKQWLRQWDGCSYASKLQSTNSLAVTVSCPLL